MEKDIVRKIRGTFARGVDSEERVVYILVEVRKLMELKEREAKEREERGETNTGIKEFPALKFYCDWAVHPVMDRRVAKQIVRCFDRYEELLHTDAFAPGKRLDDADRELQTELRDTLELSIFQRELIDFLGFSRVLQETPFATWGLWIAFSALYVSVIQDCPLRCRTEGLAFADEVVARVVKREIEIEDASALGIEWSWVSKQTGETRAYTLHLSADWNSIRNWSDF